MNKPPKNSKKNPNTAVDGLPVELVLMIMSQLSLPDLLNFALVSHSMREFAYDNAIWNAFLKPEAKDFQSARAVFMASPEKRADKYIAVDQLGKDYLRSLTTSPVTQAPARSTCVGRYAYSAPYSGSYSSMFHNPSHEYMTQPQRVVEPVKPKAGRECLFPCAGSAKYLLKKARMIKYNHFEAYKLSLVNTAMTERERYEL